jgi:hypothetical protein
MKSNLNFLFAVLVVVSIVSLALFSRGCSTPRVPEFIDPLLTFDEAMARSAESGKPVFALVSADWCTYCKSLKRNALTNSRVVSWLTANTIPVYVDATRNNDTEVAGDDLPASSPGVSRDDPDDPRPGTGAPRGGCSGEGTSQVARGIKGEDLAATVSEQMPAPAFRRRGRPSVQS